MKRVVLINQKRNPDRYELITSERATGELLFGEFPSLNWAGYVIVEGMGKKACNWVIPDDIFNPFCDFVRSFSSNLYEVAVYDDGMVPSGGQTEVRII